MNNHNRHSLEIDRIGFLCSSTFRNQDNLLYALNACFRVVEIAANIAVRCSVLKPFRIPFSEDDFAKDTEC